MNPAHIAALRALPEDQFARWYECWKKLQRQALRYSLPASDVREVSVDQLESNHRQMAALVKERQQLETDLGIPSPFEVA